MGDSLLLDIEFPEANALFQKIEQWTLGINQLGLQLKNGMIGVVCDMAQRPVSAFIGTVL